MIKALLVVMTMTGSEYNVNMPDMKTCMEQARIVSSQGVEVEALCIPKADDTAKVKEIFSLFGNMIQEMQTNELGSSYSKCKNGTGQLYTN
jgi:hypothetical protein|tara:strand:+ start:1236 stop:1508 length:273 start_codon:yes stop_codon:yes gene_type:complete